MYQRILVPVDGSTTSARGLEEAIALARLTHGRIRLLHLIDPLAYGYTLDAYSGYVGDWLGTLRAEGERILQAATASAAAAGVEADTVLHEGQQRRLHEIVEDSVAEWKADLIVIGTHGRRGVSRVLLGSDAERIVRNASVPVLLVRAPELVAIADTTADAAPASVHVRLPSSALSFE